MILQVLTKQGAFDADVMNAINANFASIAGGIAYPDYFVDPQHGSDANPGTAALPFASMSPLNALLRPGMTVGLKGVLFQNWLAPAVNDITIVGWDSNQPRQATSDGVPNGGGATWMNPATVASPLITLGESSTTLECQAWRFINIFFSNAGDAPCVKLHRKLTGADPSHASFYGCKFTGADSGIQSVEAAMVNIVNCEFFNFAGAGDTAIESIAGDGVALPLQWVIQGCRFWNNVNHIVGAFSSAAIFNNLFGWIGSTITTTIIYDATGGKNNAIWNNKVQVASDAAGITAAVVLGTNDSWGPQFYSDKEEYGDPAS